MSLGVSGAPDASDAAITSRTGALVALAKAPPTVAVRIAEVLAKSIRSGELPLHAQLPTEKTLAARFRTSRPSIREALSALQFAGYVRSIRGSGTVVVSQEPIRVDQTRLTFPAAVSRTQDVIDLLEARLVVEPEVVALAASDPNPVSLRVASELIDGMRLAVCESKLLDVSTDIHIHVALAETCRNVFLVDECKHLLRTAADPFWHAARTDAWGDPTVLLEWVDQHAIVLEAIESGDAETARRTSRQHILSVVENALSDELSQSERARLQDILDRFHSRLF